MVQLSFINAAVWEFGLKGIWSEKRGRVCRLARVGVTLSAGREIKMYVSGDSQEAEELTMADATVTVQELYAAFGRGDLPAILSKLDDNIVWESEAPAIVSFGGIRHGITEVRGFFDALARDFSDQKLTIAEYVASGDTVMTIGRYSATTKATGKKVDSPVAHYWKFRDGKVVRYVGLSNTAALVEALQPAESRAA
jgi:ketosteroid isomerase-like protein